MSNSRGILSTLKDILRSVLGADRAPRTTSGPRRPTARLRTSHERGAADTATDDVSSAQVATARIDPARVTSVRIGYAPDRDGAPDAGEIIWTWVPYEENDGRGKDRPVLVIGRVSADRVYAVRLTSKPHDGDRDYLSIGAGPWDSQGRESWVDIEQLYSVHERGLRREAAVLERRPYDRVSAALTRRYGWSASA